jgi:hypothetical protein
MARQPFPSIFEEPDMTGGGPLPMAWIRLPFRKIQPSGINEEERKEGRMLTGEIRISDDPS